ncbi:MAG TPA: cysteine--tRNA ligase [bacterium]|nr:cysteine--tRNA ligase [bacterium]
MAIKIFNTLTKQKEELIPIEPGKIRMYLCGPTVYDFFHIGNARPFIIYDIFRRYLSYRGFEVKFVMNITDIDDKIIKKSADEQVDAATVAQKYSDAFFEDIKKLGIQPADKYPRATENIPEIIALIEKLVDKGLAYVVDGDVFFSVSDFQNYGKLSGKNIDQLKSGARIEVDSRKKNPLDFALWKTVKEGEPYWDSPWGRGRPGWHIECSVMSMKCLGETFDIHAGGADLIFPHHENEIAQSEGATGKQFVRYWLHNGFLNIEGEKMSKSLGNFFTTREILTQYPAEVLRIFFLMKHYRSPVNFSEELVQQAQNALERIITTISNIDVALDQSQRELSGEAALTESIDALRDGFIAEMDDDFNTAGAMSKIFDLVKEANLILTKTQYSDADYLALQKIKETIVEFDSFLGILSYKQHQQTTITEEALIEILLNVRSELRRRKIFDLSDEIREKLIALGVEIHDRPDKPIWRKK